MPDGWLLASPLRPRPQRTERAVSILEGLLRGLCLRITGLWIGLCVGLIAVGAVLLVTWARQVRGFHFGEAPGG